MNALRNSAFSIILLAWILLLGLICVIMEIPFLIPFLYSIQYDLILVLCLVTAVIFISFAQREYKKLGTQQKVFLRRGAILAAISSLIGNLIFLIIDQIILISRIGPDFSPLGLQFILLIVVVTSCMATIPSLVVGAILAFTLLQDALNGKAFIKTAIVKGLIFGALLGASLCIAIGVLTWYHSDFYIWLERTAIVTTLAALAGSWTGWRLGKSIS